jgi:hypothetical protein
MIQVFWNFVLCHMEMIYQLFEGAYCRRFQSKEIRKSARLVLEGGGITLCRNVGN